MSAEQRYFMQILSDHLGGRPTEAPEGELDWEALSRLARIHQVDGIVFWQCQAYLPPEQKSFLQKGYGAATFYYLNRIAAVQELDEAFQAAGISYYMVKGLRVAQWYPIPALRTMGDCDIVVGSADIPAAMQLMRDLGYVGPEVEAPHEWGCDRNRMHFELHDLLVKEGELSSQRQMDFFRDLMPHAKEGVLDWNYHFLFLLIHLRKHFIFSGVGIRQFVDLAVLIGRMQELDWKWLQEQLQVLELLPFAESCFSLIEGWFGITAPMAFRRMEASDADAVTRRLLSNGVFGFQDSRNAQERKSNHLLIGKGPRWFKRLRGVAGALFPGFDVMEGYPGCDFLHHHRWLMPVAWGKRFVFLLRRGDFDQAKGTLDQNLVPDAALEERADYLSKMGL